MEDDVDDAAVADGDAVAVDVAVPTEMSVYLFEDLQRIQVIGWLLWDLASLLRQPPNSANL